jgi:hypothetical protein
MSSLYNRATPSQQRILRAVEGAIKNACDAHPELKISPHHRRSIAKRAAGTLSAQWPEVLAAPSASSESGAALTLTRPRRRSSHVLKAAGREVPQRYQRFPLRRLISELARPIRDLKLSGQAERAEAFIDALRIIHRLRGPSLTTALASASQSARPNDRAHDEPSPTTTPDSLRDVMGGEDEGNTAFGLQPCGEASPDGEVFGHDTEHFDGKEDQ